MSEADRSVILYEYPFNERIRTLLRLEDLLDKFAYFYGQTHPYCHHTALLTLFEIIEVTSRADLKGELLQELERHRQSLLHLRNNPQVSEAVLGEVLRDIERAQASINTTQGKAGQHLRENDWLMSVRSRAIIPGGTCEFDLPSYHAWLARSAELRQRDLLEWTRPLGQFGDALAIVLKLLRESAQKSTQTAPLGSFQQSMQGKTYALLQLRIEGQLNAVPEISANKYMLWIRFTTPDRDHKPRSVERDIEFQLSLCAF